jgi:hypothetical protein
MRRAIPLIGIGVFLLVALELHALAGGDPMDLTIVYSNNINGQIEPCPT